MMSEKGNKMISHNCKTCKNHEIVTKTTNLDDKEEKVSYCHNWDCEVTKELHDCPCHK